MHAYIHTYIHTHRHTYIHTYLPTYIHTYIHTTFFLVMFVQCVYTIYIFSARRHTNRVVENGDVPNHDGAIVIHSDISIK